MDHIALWGLLVCDLNLQFRQQTCLMHGWGNSARWLLSGRKHLWADVVELRADHHTRSADFFWVDDLIVSRVYYDVFHFSAINKQHDFEVFCCYSLQASIFTPLPILMKAWAFFWLNIVLFLGLQVAYSDLRHNGHFQKGKSNPLLWFTD